MTKKIEAIPAYLAVVMEGGLVQSVVSNRVLPDLNVLVIDYDAEGTSLEDRVTVPQSGGGSATAWSSFYDIETATIDLAAVVRQLAEAQEAQP